MEDGTQVAIPSFTPPWPEIETAKPEPKPKAVKAKPEPKPKAVKAKPEPKPKAVKAKPEPKPKAVKSWRKAFATTARSCRVDMRLTREEKNKLARKAKETRRTVTSIVAELIENMR